MRATVDGDLCEGYATCVSIAPDLFELDEWGYAQLKVSGELAPDQEALARDSALECPMNAIGIED